MSYSIDGFWKPRLGRIVPSGTAPILAGWSTALRSSSSFVEADLHLRPEFNDLSSPIWLVAAPGAVGKSTLAREISAQTSAVYLDLARAETVAGNYLTGGLVKNGLHALWQNNQTTVLIDALDEARLRVTQSSFEDFLRDIMGLSAGRTLPTVLFGRLGIIEEAWLILSDQGVDCPVFDIDFFDAQRAERFVTAVLERLATEGRYNYLAASLTAHHSVYQSAANTFVSELGKVTAQDGARFAGYAPVLEAIATVLAAERNPAHRRDAAERTVMRQVVQYLAGSVLEREATKLRDQLPETFPSDLKQTLYSPMEQLDRLASVVLGSPVPPLPAGLQPHQATTYGNAVRNLLPHHPFLDGTGQKPSGAVFAAVVNAHALFSTSRETASAAEQHAGRGPHTPNPFLIDFYLERAARDKGDTPVVVPEHVVILYESVRARVLAGDTVRLTVEGDDGTDELDVEIQISSALTPDQPRRLLFKSSQAGTLRFGRQVNGVAVDAPDLDVSIGSGNPVELIAPIALNVGKLTFDCSELVVQLGDHNNPGEDAAASLEARELVESKLLNAPIVRKGAELSVTWPGATAYPWTHFASAMNGANGQNIDETLRGVRRLVLAFRSHSRGRLARFEDKIEHRRITKGALGVSIRQRMMADGILTLEGKMYFLDAAKLGGIAGATYQDLKLKRFNDRVRGYARSIH